MIFAIKNMLHFVYKLVNKDKSMEKPQPQLIEKPYPPADDDCCGGGACCPCVWDYYYAQRKLWNAQRAALLEETV